MTRLLPRWGLALLALITLTGCADMKIEDFRGTKPKLTLEDYFLGESRAYGLFTNRAGDVKAQFTVDITGTMDGETLVLDERFRYQSGRTDKRVWRIKRTGKRTYEGTAGDIVGVANGEIAGNALNWSYVMDLAVDDTTYRVKFDDWMFLQEDGVLLNRAVVTKWGFHVGTVTLSFRKLGTPGA
ncbi:DUF3833 domain-containing protein [Yunchengibacter salinarum]|uniref:DUF3833 domain-containing protein n=1 Tax=Yunchengibacter salinarum TaxID=3133399 RepID=UPI0035B5D9CC